MSSRDYEEFIGALNAYGVRYLVVGAHAVAFHARPRATKDLDILLEPTQPRYWLPNSRPRKSDTSVQACSDRLGS